MAFWSNWFKPKSKITTVDALIAQNKTLWNICKFCDYYVRYSLDTLDRIQSPEETLTVRKGECVDMAVLMEAILRKLGYLNPQIWKGVYVKQTKKLGHAVVVFHATNGWFYISNFAIVGTYADSLEETLKLAMPDRFAYIQIDPVGKVLRTI